MTTFTLNVPEDRSQRLGFRQFFYHLKISVAPK